MVWFQKGLLTLWNTDPPKDQSSLWTAFPVVEGWSGAGSFGFGEFLVKRREVSRTGLAERGRVGGALRWRRASSFECGVGLVVRFPNCHECLLVASGWLSWDESEHAAYANDSLSSSLCLVTTQVIECFASRLLTEWKYTETKILTGDPSDLLIAVLQYCSAMLKCESTLTCKRCVSICMVWIASGYFPHCSRNSPWIMDSALVRG